MSGSSQDGAADAAVGPALGGATDVAESEAGLDLSDTGRVLVYISGTDDRPLPGSHEEMQALRARFKAFEDAETAGVKLHRCTEARTPVDIVGAFEGASADQLDKLLDKGG